MSSELKELCDHLATTDARINPEHANQIMKMAASYLSTTAQKVTIHGQEFIQEFDKAIGIGDVKFQGAKHPAVEVLNTIKKIAHGHGEEHACGYNDIYYLAEEAIILLTSQTLAEPISSMKDQRDLWAQLYGAAMTELKRLEDENDLWRQRKKTAEEYWMGEFVKLGEKYDVFKKAVPAETSEKP